MTYAHNNGLEMVPDPRAFSEAAQTRWIPHALSSALRHGTTRHLYPATKEGFILPWKEGNDAFNIQSLRDTELAYIEKVAPQTKSWKIGPDGDTFVHADGRKITHETFEKAVRELDPGRTQVGETTLRRGLRHKQIRSGMGVRVSDINPVPLAGLHEGGTPDSLQNPVLQDATSQPVALSDKSHYYLPEGSSTPVRNAAAVTPATLGAISGVDAAPTHRAGRFAVSRSTLAAISGAKVNNDPRRTNNKRQSPW